MLILSRFIQSTMRARIPAVTFPGLCISRHMTIWIYHMDTHLVQQIDDLPLIALERRRFSSAVRSTNFTA
jgi:hypothetical protein